MSPISNLSDELVEVLSAHGELETVCLEVNSITFNGINTLIMNSPNLISLHVAFIESHFPVRCQQVAIMKVITKRE